MGLFSRVGLLISEYVELSLIYSVKYAVLASMLHCVINNISGGTYLEGEW